MCRPYVADATAVGIGFDERLDLEFAYTSYRDSCRDLYSPAYCCRRPIDHDGAHAAGFGAHRVRWDHQPDHDLDEEWSRWEVT